GSLAHQLIQDIEADKEGVALDSPASDAAGETAADAPITDSGAAMPIELTSVMDEAAEAQSRGVDDGAAEERGAPFSGIAASDESIESTRAWSYTSSLPDEMQEGEASPASHSAAAIDEAHRDSEDSAGGEINEINEINEDREATASTSEATSVSEESQLEEEEEDEDSIEAYMNRLLKRVHGQSSSPSPAASTTTITPTTVADPTLPAEATAVATETSTSGESEPTDFLDPDQPLVPRSQAPERTSNLSAMRELANQSARNAISRSTRLQTRDTQLKAMAKFAQTIVALLCAAAMTLFTTWSLRYVAAVAIVVIGGVCFNEGVTLLIDAMKRIKAIEADAARDAEPEPPTEAEMQAKAEMEAKLEAKLDRVTQLKK
ncbi:MAG: hypothetical protein ACF788_08860, partial [Novipirellula sp. JB048]